MGNLAPTAVPEETILEAGVDDDSEDEDIVVHTPPSKKNENGERVRE